jgi:hypothetical protein
MRGPNFMAMANDVAGRRTSARHVRRAEEAIARKKLSVPAMKKIIRRNKQRWK